MWKSSIHFQFENDTSPKTVAAVTEPVATIAEALEKVYENSKRLNFVIVISDRMGEAVIIVQDCELVEVAFPALSDNALLATHSVMPGTTSVECLKATCFIKMSPSGLTRVFNSLTDSTVEAQPFDADRIAKRVYQLLSKQRQDRGN